MAQPTLSRMRRSTLALKKEAAYGTDVFSGTVSAADLVPAYNISYAVANEMIDGVSQSGMMGSSTADVLGGRSVEISYSMRLRGKGSAYAAATDVECNESLLASGCKATVVTSGGSEKVTYNPRDNAFESVTCYILRENAPAIKASGCFGNASISMVAGQPWELNVRLVGKMEDPADITLVTQDFSKTPQFPAAKSAGITIDSVSTHRVQSANLDFGNIVEVVASQNATHSVVGSALMGRNPRLTLDPEAVTVATHSLDARLRDGTLFAWDINSSGAQYTRVKLSGTKAQLVGLSSGTRGEIATENLELKLLINAGEDDFALVFD